MFKKIFWSFAEGIKALCDVSFSATQSLEAGHVGRSACQYETDDSREGDRHFAIVHEREGIPLTPEDAALALWWNDHLIRDGEYDPRDLKYRTEGGLTFGWWQEAAGWVFFVDRQECRVFNEELRSSGVRISDCYVSKPDTGTLRASALAHGWEEKE